MPASKRAHEAAAAMALQLEVSEAQR